MLEFHEVSRRIAQRHCACGECDPSDTPHSYVVEPIIEQLMMGASTGEPMLLTPRECTSLAQLLGRQGDLLDKGDDKLSEAADLLGTQQQFLEAMSKHLHRAKWGLIIGAGGLLCHVAGIIVGAALL